MACIHGLTVDQILQVCREIKTEIFSDIKLELKLKQITKNCSRNLLIYFALQLS